MRLNKEELLADGWVESPLFGSEVYLAKTVIDGYVTLEE